MKTFEEALRDGFAREKEGLYWSFSFGPDDRYELTFEELVGGQYYVAVYEYADAAFPELLTDKVPVRPGGSRERMP